jgi:hypothetical protein
VAVPKISDISLVVILDKARELYIANSKTESWFHKCFSAQRALPSGAKARIFSGRKRHE